MDVVGKPLGHGQNFGRASGVPLEFGFSMSANQKEFGHGKNRMRRMYAIAKNLEEILPGPPAYP